MKRHLLLACFMTTALCAFSQPGFLDTSFANKGILTSEFGGFFAVMGVQKNGKIITANPDELYQGILMIRYNEDGSLDYNFGDSGTVRTSLSSCEIFSITILEDDKILLCGSFNGATIGLARYLPNGKSDISFGNNGIAITDLGLYGSNAQASIQSDGKIVVASNYIEDENDNDRTFVTRYLPDGTVDENFGEKGIVITTYSSMILFASITVQADDKILVAGTMNWVTSHSYLEVTRYMPDGRIDSSFGNEGIAKAIFSGYETNINDIALQEDGKAVTVGYGGSSEKSGFSLVRFETNGSVDTSFGEKGIVITPFDSSGSIAKSVSIQNDGKIIAVGYEFNSIFTYLNSAISRYNTDGTLDKNFGINGQYVDHTIPFYSLKASALQPDGKIVAGGGGGQYTPKITISRYYGDPPTISLAKNIKVEEGNSGYTPAAFRVELNNVSAATVKVKYRTINGSAIAGKDYVADSGFVFIKPGKIMKTITVAVIGNNSQEPDKNFFLQIGEPKNALLGALTKAACTIKNDDATSETNDNNKSIGKNIKLSPNPAKDVLQLQGLDAGSNATISIINIDGTIEDAAAVSNSSSYNMNVGQLRRGTYYLKIQQQGKVSTIVFVKE